MANRRQAALAALLMGWGFVSGAQAADFRVLYAEPLRLQSSASPGQQKATASRAMRITAFGRNFDLVMEDNGRLLRKVSANTRQKLASTTVLRGVVKDAPDSWVRLTLRDGRYDGAIWDGSELYAIEAREVLEPALLVPVRDATARSLIYRLSDTQGGLTQKSCALDGSAQPINKPLAGYRGLLNELKSATSAALASAAKEIEVAIVADFEYTSQQGPNALNTMVTWMNVVDGIFSQQVGVAVVPTDFSVFPANNDPFTATNPQTLLDQVANYRSSSPVVSSRGLAHLLTGRELDGDIVGIAFLGSLCDAHSGVSLSQSSANFDTALIIAHELGHNFGAPHDGESGSSCSSTPRSFLMSPTLNGTTTFSTCSVQRMQPFIANAACIVSTRIRDVAVSVPAPAIQAVVNQPFDYFVDVASAGDATAGNIIVSASLPGPFVLESASLQGVACPINGNTANCQLSDLPVGETRRMTVRARPTGLGEFISTAQVSATNDSVSSNNTQTVSINVAAERDLRVTATPQPLTVVAGQPFDMDVSIAANGTQSIADVRADFSVQAEVLTASVDSGSCTVQSIQPQVSCALGTIAASATRNVHLQLVSHNVGANGVVFVRAYPQSDTALTRFGNFYFSTLAAHDISVALTPTSRLAAIGVDAPYSLEVKSNGTQSVDNVQVRISSNSALVALAIDGPATGCTTGSGFLQCNLGTMPSGTVQTIQFHASSGQPVKTNVLANVILPAPDDFTNNDSIYSFLDVRNGTEVAIEASSQVTLYDQRSASLNVTARSVGANPVDSVTATVSLPQGFSIQAAWVGADPCSVQSNVATCSMARMTADSWAFIRVDYTAPTPGVYTGTVSVSAAGDADPTNNSAALTFNVLPAVDGSVIAPVITSAITGQPIDLVFTVASNRYALVDAHLSVTWFAELAQVTATSPLGTCAITDRRFDCDFGLMPANTTIPVTVQVRSATPTYVSMNALLNSAAESDSSNNFGYLSFAIYDPGDASVSVAASSSTATVTQRFTFPAIDVSAISAVIDPFIEFDIDPSRVSQMEVSMNNSYCSSILQSSSPFRCFLGDMLAGTTQRVRLSFTPVGTGALPVTVRIGARNDVNSANNQQVVNVTVEAVSSPPPTPPPPAQPPTSPSNSGSGGGGSVDWRLVLTLGWLLLARMRRRGFPSSLPGVQGR